MSELTNIAPGNLTPPIDPAKQQVQDDTQEAPHPDTRYTFLNTIGLGGSAYVFKAYDTFLEKHVCLKMGSKPQEGEDLKDLFYRFEKEARILSSMNHPNIVQCYELTSRYTDGETFKEKQAPILVLQYVEGIDLYNYAMEYAYGYERIVDIAIQIARALNYAHTLENRVIHRDIKGSNIIINNEGHVYLIDFGISKLGTALKTTMHRFGTSGFIAPEIIENYTATQAKEAVRLIDGRADLYSLGCLLYFLVTKKLPFTHSQTTSFLGVLQDQKEQKFIPIDDQVQGCPKDLSDIIVKLIAYKRDHRFGDAKALLNDLYELSNKIGRPTDPFLNLDISEDKSIDDFSNMKNNYELFVRQNHQEKNDYFKQRKLIKAPIFDEKPPPRYDKTFIKIASSLAVGLLILFAVSVFQKQDRRQVKIQTAPKIASKGKVKNISAKQTIQEELVKKDSDIVPLNIQAQETDSLEEMKAEVKNRKQLSDKIKLKQHALKKIEPQNNVIEFGNELTLNQTGSSSYKTNIGVVESSTFTAILSSKVMTSNIRTPVTAILDEDIIIKGKVVIPSQSKIIGQAQATQSDRVNITFQTFILPNQKTIKFSGMAMDLDGAMGIQGKVNREQTKKLKRAGGKVITSAAGSLLDTVTGGRLGGQIIDQATDEALDQIDSEIEYQTQSTTVVELQPDTSFKLYIRKSF